MSCPAAIKTTANGRIWPNRAHRRQSSASEACGGGCPVTAPPICTRGRWGAKDATSAPAHGHRLALLLLHGAGGGAESFTVTLAHRLRRLGANPEVVFIAGADPLAERLSSAGVPYGSLGFRRGRDVAWHPRRFASEIAHVGSDGALLAASGFISAALRCGGYHRP